LHVQGDARVGPSGGQYILLAGDSSKNSIISRDGVSGTSGHPLAFSTGTGASSESMRIDSSGRLLVGTSSVSGDFGAVVSTGGTARVLLARESLPTSAGGLGSLGWGRNNGEVGATIGGIADANWTSGSSYPTRLVFSTTRDGQSSPSERLRISADGTFKLAQYPAVSLSTSYSGEGAYIRHYEAASGLGSNSERTLDIASCGDGTKGGNVRFFTNPNGSASATERMRISSNGSFFCDGMYDDTTAQASNMNVTSTGQVRRSTSSIKYKTSVETIEDSYADALLNCRPVWYRSTCKSDNPDYGYWGFIAEEVAEIDPRLVHWKTVEVTYDDKGSAVETPCEPEPEGVQYDRFVPHLLNLIKRQQQAIETLEAKVAALEAN
jgi:hypothetical protein